jgi:hypothetical protein
MARVERSTGITPSEKRLAEIAERSFLDLWSYPNVYRDQGIRQRGEGSELCDLLVVCGKHVVLFADKSITFSESKDTDTAWRRWYRRAVKKAADQLLGAVRWLDVPQRLFLDPGCKRPFPIELPREADRQVHLVVIAWGASQACREYFVGSSGSLMVVPALTAELILGSQGCIPFSIGDVYPTKPFVHVLDDATIDIVLTEFDTITDFVQYLSKKELLVRSGRLISAAGEEELVAYYIKRMNSDGEHDFTSPSGKEWEPNEHLLLDEGDWQATQQDAQYRAKKAADEISYLWDNLIAAFTKHLLAGTSLVPGEDFEVQAPVGPLDLTQHELAIRFMALETRFSRRILSAQLGHAIENARPDMRSLRVMIDGRPERQESAYVFLQFPQELSPAYSDYRLYRQHRGKTLYAACAVVLARNPKLKRVIGIATEPPRFYRDRNVSEDVLLLEGPPTAELIAEAEGLSEALSILRPQTTRAARLQGREYPEVQSGTGAPLS